jgi:phosphonate transport system substrate-binding protein
MKFLSTWFFALLLLLPLTARADNKVYSFGVVPQQAASELAESWAPFLAWLSERTGVKLRFATAPDIPSFEKRLARGEYDFAYMNPYHYTVFHRQPGYLPVAREKDRKIKGILVVRKDSPIQDIKELHGATLVFPAPAAFAASILPRAALKKEGVAFQAKFVSSHDSVYLNVLRGLNPAGGGIVRTLDLLAPEIRSDLRVLWTTPSYTPHAIPSQPRVSPETVTKLQRAMADMERDAAGQKMLKLLGFKGLEAAQDADWNDIRQLRIKELETE